MRNDRLQFNDISKEFFEKVLEPFRQGYNAGSVLNKFWQKYTLHEVMANLYILLEKAKENEQDLPMFKARYKEFVSEVVSAISGYYFYYLRQFPSENLNVPVAKTFHGEVYPGRRGFIDELDALFPIWSNKESTNQTQQDEKETTTV